jgi:hypothetical protein
VCIVSPFPIKPSVQKLFLGEWVQLKPDSIIYKSILPGWCEITMDAKTQKVIKDMKAGLDWILWTVLLNKFPRKLLVFRPHFKKLLQTLDSIKTFYANLKKYLKVSVWISHHQGKFAYKVDWFYSLSTHNKETSPPIHIKPKTA